MDPVLSPGGRMAVALAGGVAVGMARPGQDQEVSQQWAWQGCSDRLGRWSWGVREEDV